MKAAARHLLPHGTLLLAAWGPGQCHSLVAFLMLCPRGFLILSALEMGELMGKQGQRLYWGVTAMMMLVEVVPWHSTWWSHSPPGAGVPLQSHHSALSLQATRPSSNACQGSSASESSLASWGHRVPANPR